MKLALDAAVFLFALFLIWMELLWLDVDRRVFPGPPSIRTLARRGLNVGAILAVIGYVVWTVFLHRDIPLWVWLAFVLAPSGVQAIFKQDRDRKLAYIRARYEQRPRKPRGP